VGRRFEEEHKGAVRADGGIPLVPRFAYNAKLNTCIYRGGALLKQGDEITYILDLATNENLAQYMKLTSEDAVARESKQKIFVQRERELFGPEPGAPPK